MATTTPREFAPVQTRAYHQHRDKPGRIPWAMHLQAYEVYCHVYSPQAALVEGSCRGGFGLQELAAFLYAYPHPRDQWRRLVEEAFAGMQGFA